jgi:beta-glucanase (GH16 family)
MPRRRLSTPLAIVLLVLGLVAGALPALATAATHPTTTHRTSTRHTPVTHRIRRHATRRGVSGQQPLRAVNAATTSGTPSGVAMPTGDIPGWHQVFADDFTGSALDSSKWRLYWGQPGGDPGGWFDPAHVSVSGGQMVLAGYRDPADGGKWATAGVSSSPGLVQTYGKYLVRFRFDSGVGIAHAILLWPGDNSWPPEIDFSEDNGANRQTTYATLHYGANNTQVQRKVAVDLTQWHTLGVEWTPGRLVYTLDGKPWSTVTGPQVPAVPMTLDIQTQAWACGTSTWEQCPNATTPAHVNLYVDWVVAYAPA